MLVDPATKDVDLEEFRRKWKATEKKAQSTRDLSTMSSHKAFECTALAETGDDEEPSAQESKSIVSCSSLNNNGCKQTGILSVQ